MSWVCAKTHSLEPCHPYFPASYFLLHENSCKNSFQGADTGTFAATGSPVPRRIVVGPKNQDLCLSPSGFAKLLIQAAVDTLLPYCPIRWLLAVQNLSRLTSSNNRLGLIPDLRFMFVFLLYNICLTEDHGRWRMLSRLISK